MKETGIIFSTALVPLVLDGTKTVTRRVIKHPTIPNSDIVSFQEMVAIPPQDKCFEYIPEGYYALLECNANQNRKTYYFRSPYGGVGDWLWMRETHKLIATEDGWKVRYRSDNALVTTDVGIDEEDEFMDEQWFEESSRWRPSIHMPKWASRKWLEIVSVRPERLQNITYADCRAEGSYMATNVDDEGGFVNLWDSINPKYPWSGNYWVFRIEWK